MQSFRIEQLGAPVNVDDAATKAYVDGKPRGMTKATADNLCLGLGGGDLRGVVYFVNASKITNLGDPQNAAGTVNKRYVDSKVVSSGGITQLTADNCYLSLRGGGLKGNLNMMNNKIVNLAAPTNNGDATTKKWVEDGFASKSTLVNGFLPISGGTLSGPLNLGDEELFGVSKPVSDKSAASKRYANGKLGGVSITQAAGDARYLRKGGENDTSNLDMKGFIVRTWIFQPVKRT